MSVGPPVKVVPKSSKWDDNYDRIFGARKKWYEEEGYGAEVPAEQPAVEQVEKEEK